MSARHVRHARSKREWDTLPSRSAERSQAAAEEEREPARKAPARKDTRSWCRGKPGTEHVPVLTTEDGYARGARCGWRGDWRTSYEVRWFCYHREVCSRCGKVLRESPALSEAECPAWPGTPEQQVQAETEAAEHEAWLRQRSSARQRPVITGPQGYRRRCEKAST